MGRKWTDKELYDAIMIVVKTNKMSHFPTLKQIEEFYGNKAISAQLSKHGGIRRWSKICDLPPAKTK